MKSSRTPKAQYKNAERKTGKQEKAGKLDRKSSRGMIFENEELRLRTININAEVERGQTDIKRLRRENEQLRREIWTLRDECDRLNKRFKAKLLDYDHGVCSARGSGGSSGCTRCPSQSNSDDSDSCDKCKGDDGTCNDDCCRVSTSKQNKAMDNTGHIKLNDAYAKLSEPQNLQNAFDHLSVVSEETTFSNSETQAASQSQSQNESKEFKLQQTGASSANSSQTTLQSLVAPLTPLTPIEMVANQLNDLQATVPPLSYFENVLQRHMGSPIGMTPDTSCIAPNCKIVKHTNGWDYNLQSPFAQRKSPLTSSTSSPSSASTMRQRYPPTKMPTLTTFVPTTTVNSPVIIEPGDDDDDDDNNKEIIKLEVNSLPTTHPPNLSSTSSGVPVIETVAITTMSTIQSPPKPLSGSQKHFFSPLKPRLKINTSLATKNVVIPTPPIVSETSTSKQNSARNGNEHQNCDPPDIYVSNALASPYNRPPLPTQASQLSPLRTTNSNSTPPNVSPRQHHQCQHRHQQQLHQYYLHRQHQFPAMHHQQSMKQVEFSTANVDAICDVEVDIADDDFIALVVVATCQSATVPSNHIASATITTTSIDSGLTLVTKNVVCATPLSSLLPLNKPNEPIYAIAQTLRSDDLISATTFTQPLMTSGINSPSKISISAFNFNTPTHTFKVLEEGIQTESVNLEAILNDIEHISEDILAMQLVHNKIQEKNSNNATLKLEDKTKKPYRSEMNLMLCYDGPNTKILPAATQAAMSTNNLSDNDTNSFRPRARSLERNTTESPSPKMPDAMPTFPDKHTYIGFDHFNKIAATTQKSVNILQRVSKSASSSPQKPPPPIPPARLHLPQLDIQCGGINRSAARVNGSQATPAGLTEERPGTPLGLVPNKSHLFKALANAAAKLENLHLNSATPSKSLDNAEGKEEIPESPSLESTKRKQRRVSIVCNESPKTPAISPIHQPCTPTALSGHPTIQVLSSANPLSYHSTGSCSNLTTATPTNPLLQCLKQTTSHSTPNSPHSMRRRNEGQVIPATSIVDDNMMTPRVNYHHQHQCSSGSNKNSHNRRSSQDSLRDSATVTTAQLDSTRSRCSRRHSDTGTVASNGQRNSGASIHHHHHHHHRQYSSTLMNSAHPHHSHHPHQDSNNETNSVSDRNSNNSFGSSRESSTSFSMRSQRRKISVSSHTGGKIPWCGCWGNGCL